MKRQTILDMLDGISSEMRAAIVDSEKFDNGVKAAAARVRKNMQSIKVLAQDIRMAINERKKEM